MELTNQDASIGSINVDANGTTSEKSNSMKYGMIACAVLAVVGIGFGVYGMVRKPEEKAEQKNATSSAELESELSSLKQKYSVLQAYVKDLEASGTEIPEEAKSASDTNTPVSTSDGDTDKYIYLGEWGVKIKKPQPNVVDGKTQDGSMSGVSYAFDGYRLHLWATVYRNGDQAAMGGEMDPGSKSKIASPYLATIQITYADSCQEWEGEKIGSLDEKKSLCYSESTDGDLKENFSDSQMERYIRPAMEILKSNFTNMSNYSSL